MTDFRSNRLVWSTKNLKWRQHQDFLTRERHYDKTGLWLAKFWNCSNFGTGIILKLSKFRPNSEIGSILKLIQFWNGPNFDLILKLSQFWPNSEIGAISKLDQNWHYFKIGSKLDQHWEYFKIGSKLIQNWHNVKIGSKLG